MCKLETCPCGDTPNSLIIAEGKSLRYAFVYGDCCNEWFIEFKTYNHTPESDESMVNAITAWNNAMRGY